MLAVSAANFVTKWQGSGPENVRSLFEKARRYAPAIIFIDEIDAIGKTRQGGFNNQATEQTLNALLVEMDGFGVGNSRRPVVVIAATNIVETLDTALRRRFDREVEVDRPDREARLGYLRYRLHGRYQSEVEESTMARLATQSAGYTVADLERVIELAGRLASRAGTPITSELLEDAFERFRLGERRPLSDRETLLRIARHEAGHCLLSCLAGLDPIQVSIVSRNRTGGFVENQTDEEFALYTKAELESRIRIAMGGRAAEVLYYGPEDGLSTGASSDLRKATAYATAMIAEYGMGPDTGPFTIAEALPAAARTEAAGLVRAQLERGVELLRGNRTKLDRLVEELLSRNRLTNEEITQVIGTHERTQE
jgi:ATP-dependent Zn protease